VKALVYKEERTISEVELCERAISLIFDVSDKKLKHAHNILDSHRRKFPFSLCPRFDQLPPHGNALARRIQNPVYLEVYKRTVKFLFVTARREDDGSWRLPSRLSRTKLFELSDPKSHEHPGQFNTFCDVLDDLGVKIYDPGCFSLIRSVSALTVAAFYLGTHPSCKICAKVLSSTSTSDIARMTALHFQIIATYRELRDTAFFLARSEPNKVFAITIDFASAKYSQFPTFPQAQVFFVYFSVSYLFHFLCLMRFFVFSV
jgi:hypothetical protein